MLLSIHSLTFLPKWSRRPLMIEYRPIGPALGPGDWVQGPLSPDSVRQRLSLMSYTQSQPIRMDNAVGPLH